MKKSLFSIAIILLTSLIANSQQITNENLLSLDLPSLETLFEGAKRSSMVEFYGYRMEGQELALKTEKRKWLEYFNFFGTYQYGVMGMNSYTNLGNNFPMVFQSSGGEQIWYNFGASVSIPLDKIFDRRNRIKLQQLKLKETLKERDMWYDNQKVKIIELYTKAQELLGNLKYVIEQNILAETQYEISQKDYIMGAITAQDLNTSKGQQVQAFMQLEKVKAELKSSILQLELLSSVKIINK